MGRSSHRARRNNSERAAMIPSESRKAECNEETNNIAHFTGGCDAAYVGNHHAEDEGSGGGGGGGGKGGGGAGAPRQ